VHRFELDSYHSIMAMVAAGAGWTILTPLAILHAARFRDSVTLQPLPMLALSLAVEGPQQILASLAGSLSAAALPAWAGLAYTCVIGTAVGSGIWTWLLVRHPAGVVGPFSMLVPVFGIATAAVVLGERPGWLELLGGAVVVLGVVALVLLGLIVFGGHHSKPTVPQATGSTTSPAMVVTVVTAAPTTMLVTTTTIAA